jgi:5-hydroxyisourate hydrolase
MTVSTHVLDTSAGHPASAVDVVLQRRDTGAWVELSRDVTNADGRATALMPDGRPLPAGTYRLAFDVGGYFARRGVESFYGTVTIEFIVRQAGAHYHVPLLVSPYGYSTYRGS